MHTLILEIKCKNMIISQKRWLMEIIHFKEVYNIR